MKSPLRYQITEFDCGSVSLKNCIAFLFEREKIPAELIRAISTYTLDCYDEFGNLGQGGTSRNAVRHLSRWMTNFSNSKDFGITCEYLKGNCVTLEKIRTCVEEGGCVNLRSYLIDTEHYVTITGIDNNRIYIFDPYYLNIDHFSNNKNIEITKDFPFKYNRKVSLRYFDSAAPKKDLVLGPIKNREALLINKK